MTVETMDKCLGFASGSKNYQVSVTAKAPGFPENLLQGNEAEQYIRTCKEKGMSHREIQTALNKSGVYSITYTVGVIRKKESLYWAWTEFWEEIEQVRPMRLDAVCAGTEDIPEKLLIFMGERGIVTVEEFLTACVTMTATDMKKKYVRAGTQEWITIKRKILEKIREQIILTVRISE